MAPYVEALYAGLRSRPFARGDLFRLGPSGRGRWRGESPLGPPVEWSDPSDGLAWLDDHLTIGLQHRRPDLLFVHAAAIARAGRVVLLVAESGGGKSTTTWAALHHGFTLLSDELAPVEPASLLVHPYPRAVCLKQPPPLPYRLPAGSLHDSAVHYVATRRLPSAPSGAGPLAMLVFVSYSPHDPEPSLRAITAAESAARLYATSLNVLAHGGEGMDTVLSVAARTPSFVLRSGDLRRTCALLAAAVDGLVPPAQARGSRSRSSTPTARARGRA